MDAAAVTTPEPAGQLLLAAGAGRRGLRGRAGARDLRRDGHRVALGVVLLVTLGLRLWGIKQGLPYSYNSDEASHFVPRAISFFSHDLNPQYFLNPPAYSYLLHIVFELWFGSADAVRRAYASDPTEVFVVARVVAAVLGTLAVWLTYLAGQRLFNRTVAPVAGSCRLSTHLCFGNYKGHAVGPRRYAPLFPAFLGLQVDEIHLEMASREFSELELIGPIADAGKDACVGIIDVKSYYIETPDDVAARVRCCLQYASPERLSFAPDCGLSQTARWASRQKLKNMVEGVATVARELGIC